MLSAIDWTRPWFRPFAEIAASNPALIGGDLRQALNAHAAQLPDLRNARGMPLRFVPQANLPEGVAYEAHIDATGLVPTRDNLHDAFNALVWLHFPETKRLLNRLQAEAIARDGVGQVRGGLRDAATLFDENAVIFVSQDVSLFDALRGFAWRDLFVERRDAWHTRCTVVPFGHALLEKLVQPYKSVTAHAWWIQAAPEVSLDQLDRLLAGSLDAAAGSGRLAGGRSFAPLPVLGIPGWCDDNADPSFYADAGVFRPGRRATADAVQG
ncbi:MULTISPECIES: DUF3025 domain-containing protein [unclassified Cupriavidus]|uniref:DUF3025 domain-containing protein n=1 Tax=unclassified Cupriavidus TaxID=2640874 RepID=UPI001C00823D|nr:MULTISPECIES: DUF3025 domain-containing protein [unclassified Cupriavidus]MCA3182265.1 DUF3025 domain-containing protein [Cupriavidus sp.]MCA3190298.1 DUF3025 domain-containing protein [Cupriavidus sp.]MCA3197002.1 DUF3025 domain-containing protein [Cupriavidus sp.]MCA3202279.1 DUF3025 domain-containing protein [Cupriavidus sp.]MCA3205801.1 DUF3025 domain-containing protein [Cupriavidus sp.]